MRLRSNGRSHRRPGLQLRGDPNGGFSTPVVGGPLGTEGGRSSLNRGMLLANGKEALGTTALDADPDMVLRMPEDSFAPISVAAGMCIVFVGLLLKLWVVSTAGALVCAMALLAWFWPRRALREREVTHA